MLKQVKFALMGMSALMATSAFAQWTAIAYSPSTGAFGRAQCSRTYNEAANVALSACGYYDCELAGYAQNGYISLVRGSDSTEEFAHGSLHGSQWQADQSSLQFCYQKGYRGCYVAVQASSFNCY